jgi:hypothetical protein
MDDAALVQETAAELLAEHGPTVLAWLLENEALAREEGDHLHADAWWDVAVAASQQLRATDGQPG